MVRLPSAAFRCCPAWRGSPEKGGSQDFLGQNGDVDETLWCRGSASPLTGSRLEEDYEVEETVLGKGGFGTVRRAYPRVGGPACCVKSIPKHTWHAEVFARSEAEILRILDHPSICKLHDFFEDQEHIHLVLEYANGHELFDEIAEHNCMQESRAVGVMRQVFEALMHCHEKEFIHRDLKPENIMLAYAAGDVDTPSQVKLIDFGLAAKCKDKVQTPLVGTACYLAPEVLATSTYSKASDLWSAGVILHMLLTGGVLPPQKPDRGSFDHLNVSVEAQDLLHGLLGTKPEDRISSAQALAHPWTRAEHVCKIHCAQLSCFQDAAVDVFPSHQPATSEVAVAVPPPRPTVLKPLLLELQADSQKHLVRKPYSVVTGKFRQHLGPDENQVSQPTKLRKLLGTANQYTVTRCGPTRNRVLLPR